MHHLVISKAQNATACRFDGDLPKSVVFGNVSIRVDGTVKFDNESLSGTVEVVDECLDGMLPPKSDSIKPIVRKGIPEHAFCGRWPGTKASSGIPHFGTKSAKSV